MSFTIWVDADACPRAIKQILFRAAESKQVPTVLVANQYITPPQSKFVRSQQVEQGFDKADDAIAAQLSPGDLVITADVPLAAQVIDLDATALNPRGTLYTKENVRDFLRRRDEAESLRDSGLISGGPSAIDQKVIQRFANALDRFLARVV